MNKKQIFALVICATIALVALLGFGIVPNGIKLEAAIHQYTQDSDSTMRGVGH